MTTNLYEILGISPNAATDEIRRAYRRKALETHPDRLPQGASAAEKSASEDLFRKVNNAYEVLQDPQTRATYDQYGVWPPPEPTPQASFPSGPYDPFSDPFFHGPRMASFGGFGFGPRPHPRDFTDPFVLFNSIFGDFHRAFEADPFFSDRFGRRGFGPNHFGGGFFGGAFPSMLPSPYDFSGGGVGSSRMQTFSNGGNGGRWVSQSWTSSTVNGVTHSKSAHRDSEGNEHVTYRFPDGTERYTINGVEQSTSQPPRALPPSAPPAPSERTHDSVPPPPYHEAIAQPSPPSRSSRHGHYYDYPDGTHGDGDRRRHGHERHRIREHDYEQDRHGHHDGSPDVQNGASWKFWRS